MEQVLRILDALVEVFWRVVYGVAELLQTVASAMDIQIGDSTAVVISFVGALTTAAFGVRRVFFGGKGWSMLKPQTVIHHTAKTPLQVVLDDLGGCATLLLILALIALVLYAAASGHL